MTMATSPPPALWAAGRSHAAAAQTVSAGSLFLHLIVGLIVVLGLLALATRVVRRSGGLQARRQAPLAVLGRQSLGKGASVAVIKAGEEAYLIGVSQHGISRLARMSSTAAAAFTTPAVSRASQRASSPLSLVTGVAGPRRDDPAQPGGAAGGTWRSVLSALQERTVRRA